ncbi:MAG: hypothetical protein MUF47_04675 [Porphyrobacter sp.]|jgi:hypothetical protein|nr:hypothetical protein [Porphyrobacter sp.]
MKQPFVMLLRALAMALAAAAVPTAAQPASQVQLEGYVKRETIVIDARGERRIALVDPVTVVPGDLLVMGTRYSNAGDSVIENVVVSNPVPPAVRVAEVADPAQVVSVDGGQSFGSFADQTVRAADGTDRPATPDEITHFRWTIPAVAPGASGAVEFLVTVR